MVGSAPVVVVGAGLMGAASAYSLARRGVPVTVLEQYLPGHPHGGSHGSARIVRRAYGDPLYVGLTATAFALWNEVSATADAQLLRLHGALDFGPGRDVPLVATLLSDAGVPHEVLSAAAATDRFPGMRFTGDVLFHGQGGTLDADLAVTSMLRLAALAGADVRTGAAVRAVHDDSVLLADGTLLPARCVVVAAGGWVSPLLRDVVTLPPITVTRQSVFHFPRRAAADAPWPSTIHELGGGAVYHLAGGRDGGSTDDRKIGKHDPGPVVAAGDVGPVDADVRAEIVDYVWTWLPGLTPEPRGETTCLYAATPTEDFLLDRVGDVVVCSPCSGHGAKFAPLVGEYVAELVLGDGSSVPSRFRLATHHTARPGAVSL
ncbi:FAD-dependent oxidoreductase [uncultured Jatrophihabitans sp.]|uniref:FAD-dependent oxidoreductase n=1 Tax=uncultured Jatrophihabitans sp. TaxID=1610747 RepID=UPI0035CB02FA